MFGTREFLINWDKAGPGFKEFALRRFSKFYQNSEGFLMAYTNDLGFRVGEVYQSDFPEKVSTNPYEQCLNGYEFWDLEAVSEKFPHEKTLTVGVLPAHVTCITKDGKLRASKFTVLRGVY